MLSQITQFSSNPTIVSNKKPNLFHSFHSQPKRTAERIKRKWVHPKKHIVRNRQALKTLIYRYFVAVLLLNKSPQKISGKNPKNSRNHSNMTEYYSL